MSSTNIPTPTAVNLRHDKDGHTAIFRFPGGRVSPKQWEALADIAFQADGQLYITSRGALSIRGVADTATHAAAIQNHQELDEVAKAGLIHVLASPAVDEELVHRIAAELDALGAAHPFTRLTVGLDDGTGDIVGQRVDFAVQREGDGWQFSPQALSPGIVSPSDLVGEVVRVASSVISGDTPGGWESLERETGARSISSPVGWFDRDDCVELGIGVPLGMFPARVAQILAAVDRPTTVTCSSTILIHGLDEGAAEAVAKVLAPMGLVFDAASPWLKVSSCVGTAGCTRALSATREDAVMFVQQSGADDRHAHFSGCQRCCGRPAATGIDFIATGDGEYETKES